jgi:hypothetical protein
MRDRNRVAGVQVKGASSYKWLAGFAGDLIYLTEGGDASVDLAQTAGKLSVEWFHPDKGQTKAGDPLNSGIKAGSRSSFKHGDAVMLNQSLE